MVTLLHTADTHVGYRQYHRPEREADFRDAFYQVIDEAVSRDVDAVVHAGDLFNSSRPGIDALSDALEGLKRLDRADIPFLSIVGNHDGTRDRQWLDVFASLGLAVRLGESGFDIRSDGENESDSVADDSCHLALYGLDHVEPGRRDRLDYAFDPEAAKDADAAVLVAHGLFKPFPNGDWDARAICRQSTVEFDAILAGDDHTNQEITLSEFGTLLTYPGSTERTAADQRDPRGYDLVEVSSEGEIEREFRKLDTREFVYIDVELADCDGLDRVLDALDEREAAEAAESEKSETESGFADAVVVVTLTGAGERVSSGPVEEFGLARNALTVRVNDRREWSDELRRYEEVAFADPESAVEERRETLGLSENGLEVERVVRDTERVPESNVTDVIEDRVRKWLDERPVETFERTEPTDGDAAEGEREKRELTPDESAANEGDSEGETATDSTPETTEGDPESAQASEPLGTDGSGAEGNGSNEAGSAIGLESNAMAAEPETDMKAGKGESERSSSEPESGEANEVGKTAKLIEAEEPGATGDETDGRRPDETEESEASEEDERTTQATLWD